ncbi:N-acetyltransferase [Martelella alba]|uniref:N-acetyltransferase n=1 Tax=Martelella alba TaxID=2590451 RepID=A0ABY2SN08_9HYPH|nr:N-acetyltransferase [Martelella alba]TKI07270.1 N-acetyltransferase [Martelella alba]
MIRQFRQDDMQPLLSLWLESTTLAHPFIGSDYWLESLPLVRDEYLPGSRSWVDEQNGKLTGFISIMMERFIGAIFVAPAFNRQGIGSALMARAKQRYAVLSLEVYRLNHPARAFYHQQGFRQTGSVFNEETGHRILLLQWRRDEGVVARP